MQSRVVRPLPAVKLGDEVVEHVRDAIMSGEFVPGDKLSVAELSAGLQVSSMPVREAFVALAHEGLIDAGEKRGFTVAKFDRQDVADIFMVHAFIASLLGARAVEVIDTKTLTRLKRMTEQVDKLAAGVDSERTRARIETYNYEFHRTINTLVDAPRLHWFLRSATRYVPRHMYETMPAWTRLTIDEHPGIIEALEARDVELVHQRIETHVEHAAALILENLEERGFWYDPSGPAAAVSG